MHTHRSGAEAVELVADSAALLCQAPVQEPWSWWPAVQAAWQRGEHEQVRGWAQRWCAHPSQPFLKR